MSKKVRFPKNSACDFWPVTLEALYQLRKRATLVRIRYNIKRGALVLMSALCLFLCHVI